MSCTLASGGNSGGNGGAIAYQLGGGGDDDEAGEQLSALPLAVAVALCTALYPALESLAPSPTPAMAVAVPASSLQLAMPAASAAKAGEEDELDFDSMTDAISAALPGQPFEQPCIQGSSEEAAEGKLVLLA